MTHGRYLGYILVLQVLILTSLWTTNTLPQAQAQIPDAGAQRERQIEELKALNTKLDKLTDLLGGGKLQVRIEKEK